MKLKFNGKDWVESEDEEETIYLDGILKKRLDLVKKLLKKGWDCPIIIDGAERSGKSTLGITIGTYISDNKITDKNFATGMTDCANKIKFLADNPRKPRVLIVDEASLVFNSRDTMGKEQKRLMKIMDVVGQLNLCFILILPSFFDLNKQIAVRRSRFLIHVYHKEFERGRFAYFSSKKKSQLYELGKRNFGSYRKPKASFIGRFTDYKPTWYEEYLKLKNQSLLETLKTGGKVSLNESEVKSNLMYEFKKNHPEITNKDIAKGFGVCLREFYRRTKSVKESE